MTGATGQVGGALVAGPPPGVRIIAPARAALDLAKPDPGEMIVREGITAIVNCGAYTAVDRAESEPDLAMAINGHGPGVLAQAAAAAGIPIVQVSTDYVFAGDKQGAYREDDETDPQGAYGRTKLVGERAVAASGAVHAIVRTAWVVSATGHNFVKTILRLGAERDRLGIVDDQHGSPTHAGDLAAALGVVARALESGQRSSGLWHFTNRGETSWYDLAKHIFLRASIHGFKAPIVEPIATSDYPTAARRPANSLLATDRIKRDFGIEPRRWEPAIDEIVDTYCDQSKEGRTA